MNPFFKSLSALMLLLSFSFAEAEAQNCTAAAYWTFDPPPVNGMLELGATVEVCVDLVLYAPGGGAWLSGLELDFPPAWDLSTLNVVSIPEGCSAGDGEWVYLDTLACAPYFFGPGFYFDRDLDGNLCNNYGDACALLPENMTFCFSITLAGDCPSDEENLFPRIKIVSDDYFADFPSACPSPIYVQPYLDNLSLNCCGIQSGTSPGTVALCESQCLFDLLESADDWGEWTGPDGYVDTQGCGYFDVNLNVPGDYTYTILGALDCSVSSTITVIDTDLGVVGEIFACSGEYGYLNQAIGSDYPGDGTWTNPTGGIVTDGIAEFAVDGMGIYEYQYYSESGCLMTLGVEVVESYTSGESVSTVICENGETFCPFEVFQSLQAPGIEVTPGGNWIVYDEAGNYLDFLPVSDLCLEYTAILDYTVLTGPGSSLYFHYFQGSTECGFSQDTLTVTVGEYFQGVAASACAGIIDLEIYLPPGTPTEGMWTDYVITWANSGLYDCTPSAVGSVHSFLYTYNFASGCTGSVGIELEISSAGGGGDYTVEKCGDGSMFDLASLVIGIGDYGGIFTPSQMVVLLPQNSGIYTYTTAGTNCGEAVYSFNLLISENLTVSTLTTLNTDGSGYTASLSIIGGVPPYSVDGNPIAGNTFTSSIIPLGTSYSFAISDAGPCSDIDVMGEHMPPCTVSAGESPGEMELCQPAPFCLFNELANADTGGVWSGPPGWVDAGCGLVDPSADLPGNYYYIVSDGAECADTAMVTLVPIELGVLQEMYSCGISVINLYQGSVSEPGGGFWMAPGYPQILDTIPNGLVNPELYPSGIYTYIYYDAEGCLTTLEVNLIINPGYLGDATFDPVTICSDTMNFSPAAAIGLYSNGPSPLDGNWLVYDATGTVFLDFLAEWDISLSGEYFVSMGSSLIFKYIFGAPPCTSTLITLPVSVSGGVSQVQDTVCQSDGVIDLSIYLLPQPNPGGMWTDQSGNTLIGMVDVSFYEPGSVHVFFYHSILDTGCSDIVEVWLTISGSVGAGDDYDLDLCGTGEMIDLYDLLPTDVDQTGIFPVSQILAIPANSGTYDYFLAIPSCGSQSAVYTLTFTEPFTSAAVAECNPGGTTFNATVEIAGGMPPYAVNGEELEGTIYEASGLAVADGEAVFVVEDDGLCDAIEMTIGVDDSDGDGICDDQEITGCMDPAATNYNPNATDAGNCSYEIGGLMAPLSEWIDETQFEKPIVGVNFGVGNSTGLMLDMRIFPNPTGGQDLNFEVVGLSTDDARIEICDILGSVRYRSVLASADGAVLKKINLDGFASGVYLIRLIDGDEILVRKVVVTN